MNCPRDLPNIAGYEFIGIIQVISRKMEVDCYVVRDKSGCMYVDGGAKYCDLIGWKEKEIK